MSWCLSNTVLDIRNNDQEVQKIGEKYFLSSKAFLVKMNENISIGIDGYLLPRYEDYFQYKKNKNEELVYQLYIKYKEDFINHVKGSFVIILIDINEVLIYNDIHSIRKFFIYNNNDKYYISDNLKLISDLIRIELDPMNAIMYCLFEHFVDGHSMFEHISFSKPAAKINVKRDIQISFYWNEKALLKQEHKTLSYDYYADVWKNLISQYFESLTPKMASLTLTGGNDSRMILAAILNLEKSIDTFSFGNPASFDCIVSKELAKEAGIANNNYFMDLPTVDWYKEYTDKVIGFGNSLVNIHRAHRLYAIERELDLFPELDSIFGGFMGGDYIKGIIYDDYITAKIMRLWDKAIDPSLQIIMGMLNEKFVNISKIDLEELYNRIKKLSFCETSKKLREFLYVFNVVGSIHDTQDITVFASQVKYSVNPFMDIDFLEMLFSSPYNMMENDNTTGNQIKRINQPEFQIKIIDYLIPELSDIRFAKKGYYTPNEFLGNKALYLLKRFIRLNKNKEYTQNFPYGKWFRDYCIDELSNVSPTISNLFNLDKLMQVLYQEIHPTTEGYWHLFTNIINLDKNVKHFTNE